jgi:hypothetical protein
VRGYAKIKTPCVLVFVIFGCGYLVLLLLLLLTTGLTVGLAVTAGVAATTTTAGLF